MIRPWLLRFHRWVALLFSLPLAVIILSGLFLSFEPILQTSSLRPGTLDFARVAEILTRHDPENRARGLAVLPYENRLVLQGGGREGGIAVDLEAGSAAEPGRWSGALRTARRLHEHFLFDLRWLVTASTIAMLAAVALGVAMGWPRLRNSLRGWHVAVAWCGLPLLVASPLTGLFLAFGISFTSPPPAPPEGRAAPLPLREAVRIVGLEKDLSRLVWLRGRGPQMLARLNEDGRFNVYAVRAGGLAPAPTNWPRLLHEGNYAGTWSGLLNVLISLALAFLLTTGAILWARRRIGRKRHAERMRPALA